MIELMCKLAGAFLILWASVCFGRDMNKSLDKRYKELMMLYTFLNHLKSEIEYMGEALPECFLKLGSKYEEPIGSWLFWLADELGKEQKDSFEEIWIRGLGYLDSKSCLEKEDIDLLTDMKDKLGGIDMEAQINAVDYVLVRIEEKRTLLNNELKDKKKAVFAVSAFVGTVILIILL